MDIQLEVRTVMENDETSAWEPVIVETTLVKSVLAAYKESPRLTGASFVYGDTRAEFRRVPPESFELHGPDHGLSIKPS